MQKSSMNARVPQLPYVIAVLFLLAGFCLYGSAGHDDSHITFWASYTLEHYGDILNYNGDRVEQSSSLLLTLLIALIAKLTTVDVVSCGYVLTYLAGAAAILLCWQAAETWEVTYPLAALLLLASSPAFLLWNTSGMESTLAAVCVLGFVLVWGNILDDQRTPTPAAVGRGLLATLALVTVRPEMISLVTALAFAVFIYRRIGRWRGRVALIVFYATVLLAISGVIVFRHFYFGSPVPLPVYAKVSSFSARHLQEGMFYLLHYALANPVMLFGLGAALFQLYTLLRNEQRQPAFGQLLLAIALLAYAAFIIITGGDWMQAGRFLVPVLPLAALNLVIFLAAYSSRTVTGCCLMLILLQVYMNVLTLRSDSHGTPLWASYHITAEHQQRYTRFEQYNQEHLRDMAVIDQLDQLITALHQGGIQPVSVLSGQAGMVFFYTAQKHFREVRFIDNRGLTEDSLLHCRLMDNVARSSQGLVFSVDDFFARQPGLNDQCHIPRPDIVYDLNDMTRQLPQRLEQNHYTLVHQDRGKILDAPTATGAFTLPSANFIMVANDLLDELGHPPLNITNYTEMRSVERW